MSRPFASEWDISRPTLQDLWELARADSGQIHFHLEPVVLNKLAGEVVEMGKQFSDRQIILKIAKNDNKKQDDLRDEKYLVVIADANRLKEVLLNLIDNAVKYSDVGSPITVALSKIGDRGIIQVCDRGSGIPRSQQSRIFDRFYRIDDARNRATGSVKVSSKLNEGSVFTVILPSKR